MCLNKAAQGEGRRSANVSLCRLAVGAAPLDDLQVVRLQRLLTMRLLEFNANALTLWADDAALQAVERGIRQGVRLHESSGRQGIVELQGLGDEAGDLLEPLGACDCQHVVVGGRGPAHEPLVCTGAALVALRALDHRDDLVALAVHHQRRTGDGGQLAVGVERLLQGGKDGWSLRAQDLRREHLDHRQPLDGHEPRVHNQAAHVGRILRSEVHRARRAYGPAHGNPLGTAAARRVQDLLARPPTRFCVRAECRELGLARAPREATVVDGKHSCAKAEELLHDDANVGAHLRVPVEVVDHCLHLFRLRGQIQAVAHSVSAANGEGPIADRAGGGTQVGWLLRPWVEGNHLDHGHVPDLVKGATQ
mmetsp:Transcript_52860/g.153822  ORF Transcript_52860/g.153822 Transcript_52860/m.153822 type:complete len:364 (+) Transcript_52860:271-1362(+)